MKRLSWIFLLAAAFALALANGSDAQKSGRKGFRDGGPPSQGGGGPDRELMRAFSPMRADLDKMRAAGLMETGLEPRYPREAECLPVTSPFGAGTRSDGSQRNTRFYHGYHGGMDITADEGTPVLAIADGKVVFKHEGRNIGGIAVVLQHRPEDTGLPVWTYTEYKHLAEMPDLKIGQRLGKGHVVGPAGMTGTAGRHYGPDGFSHLHLTAFFSPVGAYFAGRMLMPKKGQWLDPMALYRGAPLASAKLRDLPKDKKAVPIPYKTPDGRLVPEDTKLVWPFACTPK